MKDQNLQLRVGRAYVDRRFRRLYIQSEDRDNAYPFVDHLGNRYRDDGEACFGCDLWEEAEDKYQRRPEAQRQLESAPDLRTLIEDALKRSGNWPIIGFDRDALLKALAD